MDPREVPDKLLRVGVAEYQRPDRTWPTHDTELVRDVLAAVLPEHERQVRERVAQRIAETQQMWSDEEPEGPSGCVDADEHNCHLSGGEAAFGEALRIVRGGS